MAVADAHQRTRHGNRQVQDRSGDQFLAVDVAAADGPGRDGGVLAWLVPREARHAVKRGCPHRVPSVAGRYSHVRVNLPQQPGRWALVQAESPGQRGVVARGDGVAPGVGPQGNEAHRKHLAWHRPANSDPALSGNGRCASCWPSSAPSRQGTSAAAGARTRSVSAATIVSPGSTVSTGGRSRENTSTVVDGDGSSWWRVMQRSSPHCGPRSMNTEPGCLPT
jgi:hypothetical protein